MSEVEQAIERWRRAGLITEEIARELAEHEAAPLTAVSLEEAEPGAAEPASYRSRLADFAAYLGAATVVIAVWLLTPSLFGEDEWGRSAINLAASAASVGLAFAAGRLRLSAAADAFSAAALFLLVTGLAVLFAQVGGPRDAALGWLVVSAAAALLGGVLALRVHSRLAAIAAAASIIALPAALAIERSVAQDGRADATLVRTISSFDLWVSLVLVWLVAAALSVSVCRGWLRLPPRLVVWVLAGISLTVAGCLIGIVIEREAVGYDVLLLIGAIVFAGLALWQRSVTWLPASGLLLIAAAVGAATDPNDIVHLALVVCALALTFSLFHRVFLRVPLHPVAGYWEAAVWIAGVIGAFAIAFADGAWPVVGVVWGLALVAMGFRAEAEVPFAAGVVAFYGAGVIFIATTFETTLAVGIGLLLAGLTIALAAMLWRRRFRLSDRDAAESFPLV